MYSITNYKKVKNGQKWYNFLVLVNFGPKSAKMRLFDQFSTYK